MPYSTVTSYSNPTVDSQTNLSNAAQISSNTGTQPSDLMKRLLKEKKIARDFQDRRHGDWDDTYDLYRGVNKTNRLTQRQAVNIPLMKETVKTLLSKVDDAPMVDWKELSGDEDKQMVMQEKWNRFYREENVEGTDIQDKKSVIMYGRSFRFLNWVDGSTKIKALDIYDVVVDPLVSNQDIETARFLIRQNIFRTLREVLADDRYDEEAKGRLKNFLSTKDGIIQSESNRKEVIKKQQRLKDMGVLDDKFPNFSAGDIIINLTEHYTQVWSKKKKEFERHVVVYADDKVEMMVEKLEDLIGVSFWPFVTWGEDIETVDFWSDGPADIIRTPNKILNVWFSQLVENRTLKNFQMHWYDATIQGYIPQTYEPGPGRMLPSPGDPNKTIMPVQVDGLDDTMGAINFLITLGEKATSTAALDKGQKTPGQSKQTKSEVQTLVQSANQRITAMSKFYRRAWYELCVKWYKMEEANSKKKITLYKTSQSGKVFSKDVYPKDWKSEAGYEPVIRSTSEQEQEKTKSVQRFQFVLQQFPSNPALKRIAQRRMLDILDLTPQELKEVEEAEKQMDQAAQQQQPSQPGQPQQPQAQPQQQPQKSQKRMSQLATP